MVEQKALDADAAAEADLRSLLARRSDPEPPSSRRRAPGTGETGKVVPLDGGRRGSPHRATYPPPVSRPRGGESGAEGQLDLLEFLLSSDDLFACAERSVEWLGDRAGVERVLCAVVDPSRGRLIGVAGWGLPPHSASEFSRDLSRRDDPLVRAMSSATSQMFRVQQGAGHPATPFGRAPFMTFPLRDRRPHGDSRLGMLITSPVDSGAARAVRWLATMLAQKLVRLLGHGARGRRELDAVEAEEREAAAELVRRAEVLRRQELALEQAEVMRSQFLSGVSHELRTPLNAIVGYTSMLLQGVAGDMTERQRSMLSRIDINGRNLLATINDVLDISRIEGGRMPLVVSELALADVIRDALEELRPAIVRSAVMVQAEVLPDLPLLCTDAAKLKQILLNLLANALKFTEEGSVTIRASFDETSGLASIEVIDTGIGISKAEQERLFQEFHRVDCAINRHHGGAGLGLAICQQLASLLGGRIDVTSAPALGSTFTLRIPLTVPSGSGDKGVEQRRSPSPPDSAGSASGEPSGTRERGVPSRTD